MVVVHFASLFFKSKREHFVKQGKSFLFQLESSFHDFNFFQISKGHGIINARA